MLLFCSIILLINANAINFKEAIAKEQANISHASPALHKKDLAILYYKDQNQEKAFEIFLEAINEDIPENAQPPSLEENELFENAINDYLENDEKLQNTASSICKKYLLILKKHPDYHQLGYVLAAAYANLEMFPEFFEQFFKSHHHFPNQFFAYKGKAALHAQLYARRRTLEERQIQQEKIIQNLENAVQSFPKDTTLYKMIVVFAPENKKKTLINRYLNKIIEENIIIPRREVVFYVHQAIAVNETPLAKRFLNKSREWHPNSRSLDAAQHFIKDRE